MKSIVIACTATAALLLPQAALSVEVVASCGGVYEGAAVLADDLDCTGHPTPFIVLTDGALDLAGHTITANIFCEKRPSLDQRVGDCVVQGPGTVRGCIDGYRLQISDVTMSFRAGLCDDGGAEMAAVSAWASLNLVRSEVSGYPGSGVYGWAGGTKGTIMKIVDSTIRHVSDRGPAVAADRLSIVGSTIEGQIVSGRRAQLRSSDVTGLGPHYDGVWSYPFSDGSVKLIDTTITGMTNTGIRAGNIKLKNSVVSGSCTAAAADCKDVIAKFGVRALRSSCGTSYCEALGQSCGVCAND